jgi:hypothetical protein
MPFDQDKIDEHRKHLAEVSSEVLKHRFAKYRIEVNLREVVPLVCRDLKIDVRLIEWRRWLHPLDPISLDDLKNWFGVPNEAAKALMNEQRAINEDGRLWGGAKRVLIDGLPKAERFEFFRLKSDEKLAVHQMAKNLLYGYVAPEQEERPEVRAVIRYMLDQTIAMKPHIFVASDLIVCPNREVILEGMPVALFNNVLIYGNGKITTRRHIKIDAFQIKHISV